MKDYTVTWTIDIYADSPLEAAKLARDSQIQPDTSALVFYTFTAEGEACRVDLLPDPPTVVEL